MSIATDQEERVNINKDHLAVNNSCVWIISHWMSFWSRIWMLVLWTGTLLTSELVTFSRLYWKSSAKVSKSTYCIYVTCERGATKSIHLSSGRKVGLWTRRPNRNKGVGCDKISEPDLDVSGWRVLNVRNKVNKRVWLSLLKKFWCILHAKSYIICMLARDFRISVSKKALYWLKKVKMNWMLSSRNWKPPT